MSYCEKVDINELKSYIKKETGLHSYIKLYNGSLSVNIFNSIKNINGKCIFEDFGVIPINNISNKALNQLKFIWNTFLCLKFGEEYKKAYHDYYFKNVDVDILKKDDTQDK